MFYTGTLEHDLNDEYRMTSIINEGKHSLLKDAIPSFFSRMNEVPGFHVIILCSDRNEEWTCQSFQGLFNRCEELCVRIPPMPAQGVGAKYCISVSDKKPHSILEAIEIIANIVRDYLNNSSLITMVSTIKSINFDNDESRIWQKELAQRFTNELLNAVGVNGLLFYMLLTMPLECYEVFKSLHIPKFIEFVVRELADDPDMENVTKEKEQLRDANRQLTDKYNNLKRDVITILNDVSVRLKEFKSNFEDDHFESDNHTLQSNIKTIYDITLEYKAKIQSMNP